MRLRDNLLFSSLLKIIFNIFFYVGIFIFFVIILFTFPQINLSKGFANLLYFIFVINFLLILFVIYQFLKIFDLFVSKTNFVESITRFRIISYNLFIIGFLVLLNNIIKYKGDAFFIIHIDENGISSRMDILFIIILGCFFLSLSEVLKNLDSYHLKK